MPKHVLIGLLTAIGGLAGGLLGKYIEEQEKQPNSIVNKYGLIGAILILIISLVLNAWLSTEKELQANWRWHRWLYLKRLKTYLLEKEGQRNFGQLDLRQRTRSPMPQIVGDGVLQNMVETLLDLIRDDEKPACKVLILGEPGSGKTTGIEHLTYQLAIDAVGHYGFGGRIPVLAHLGDYSNGPIVDFAAANLKILAGKSGEVLGKGLKKLIEKDQVILILDSLDEALGDRRDVVRAQLKELVESESYRSLPVVITGRTREDPSSGLDRLQVFEIQDLDNPAVKTFIKNYKPPKADEKRIWAQLERYNLLKPRGLGKNPFWLRVIVETNVFNRNKGALLNEAVDRLLKREWDEKRENKQQWKRVLARDVQLEGTKSALSWLAYKMSIETVLAKDSGNASQILSAWLGSKDWYKGLTSHDVVMLGQDAQLLQYTVQRKIESQPLQFRHRLLQEFLTAWAMRELEKPAPDVLERFSASDQYWETLILLGGISEDRGALIEAALGNGLDSRRILLAIALLHSHTDIDETLRTKLLSAFVKALENGVTDELKKAAQQLSLIIGDSVVDAIGQLLNSGVAVNVKLGLIEILTPLSSEKVVGYLIPLVDDPDIAEAVNKAFVAIGEPAIEPLIASLRNHSVNSPLRVHALVAIGAPAVPALIRELETPDPYLRQAMVQTLGEIADSRAILPLMAQLSARNSTSLDNTPSRWQLRPFDSAADFQKPGTPVKRKILAIELNKAIRDMNNGQKILYSKTVEALVRIGAPAVPHLIKTLSTKDAVWESIEALAQIGAAPVLPPISTSSIKDPILEKAVPLILAMIGPPAVDALIRALVTNDVEVRNRLIEILVAIGDPAKEALQKAADDEEPNIWVGAAQALRIIESAGNEADEIVDPHVRKLEPPPQLLERIESRFYNNAKFQPDLWSDIGLSPTDLLASLKNYSELKSYSVVVHKLCLQNLTALTDEDVEKRLKAVQFFVKVRNIYQAEFNSVHQAASRTSLHVFFKALLYVASQALTIATGDSNSSVRESALAELLANFTIEFPVNTLFSRWNKDPEVSRAETDLGIDNSPPEVDRIKENILRQIELLRDSA